jgi:hypothetical protein
MDRIEIGPSKNSAVVTSAFVAAVTFILSRCLAMIVEFTMGGIYEVSC